MPASPSATEIIKKLTDAGFIAYFAGGWVRDFLMGRRSDDIDIATSASVEDIQRLFPKTIPVGISFGIVIVVHNQFQFEVASFRKEKGYADGRRPTSVEPATPEEDAQRRDFTINGMFYDPLNKKLFDFVEGQKDLESQVIRAIGNPHERFLEDRLRMMRAVRYATRFNFEIEPKTFQAILDHAHTLLPSVAMERIWQEFKKMSQFAHFDKGLVLLQRLKLLSTIFPILKDVPDEEIAKRVQHIPRFPKGAPTITELLELFPNYSLENVLHLCDYLKLSNSDKNFAQMWQHAKALLEMPSAWQAKLEPIEWAYFYAHPDAVMCLKIYTARLFEPEQERILAAHTARMEHLKLAIARIESKTPIVTSRDLLNLGILPGRKMGTLLKEAERIAINGNIDDSSVVIARLQESPIWLEP